MTIRPRSSLSNVELQRPSALNSTPRDAKCLWLDKNENLDAELAKVSQAVLASMLQSSLSTYPEAGELYRKLARWVGVTPDSLLLTPGSDGAIRLTFETFVESGDVIVHTNPTFAMYPVYGQMFGADVRTLDYQRNGLEPRLDAAQIIRAVQEFKPKLLCLPNPDSPTGTVLPPEVLREILAECESNGTVLLLDEAYHPFYDWSAVAWTQTSRNLIVARTFAKAWGAAGIRMGYAVGHPSTIALLHKMRPMYEVSTFGIEFMSRLIDQADEMHRSVSRINAGKTYFVNAMRHMGFHALPTCGNFVHIAFAESAPAVRQALAGKVLYRASFDHLSLAGYSRFTVAPQEVMEKVVRLIQQALEKNSS